MESSIHALIDAAAAIHWSCLLALIAVLLAALGKSADILVNEAVILAERSSIPKVVIGATLVSLGTTTPEAAVSVLAAIHGDPGLALGNAVGSVICDTGLILGLACVIGAVPLDRRVVNRQGWIQFGSGVLLVACSLPFSGRIPRGVGFLFLGLLAVYLYKSIAWARGTPAEDAVPDLDGAPLPVVVAKIVGAVAMVVATSHLLIPAVEKAALLIGVPEDIIAATLVAFGTSLPELVTSVTAVRKGHGELAVGNVVGADILNVLFVTGAAAAVTAGGLAVPRNFFILHFPAMMAILLIFRAGIFLSGESLKKPFGFLLLACYAVYLILQFTVLGAVG